MKLSELLEGISYTGVCPDVEIAQVACDTRSMAPPCVFVCIKGARFDGHDHAKKATENGAAAIVCAHDTGEPNQMIVENPREVYARMCAALYGHPSKRLKLIGVTGTNGKTTITCLLKHILENAGKKVGLIGTIHNEIDDMSLPAKHTTPDPAELHALFARMAEAGCEYVVMETSSHAFDQDRLAGCHFEAGVFTNLTQDHLDYHGTMENYFAAKKKLFSMSKHGIINIDDAYGLRLLGTVPCETHTFSVSNHTADFFAEEVVQHARGVDFKLVSRAGAEQVRFGMPGSFSVSNAMAAAACLLVLGLDLSAVADGLNICPGVKGRAEVLPTDSDFTVICDYAHSPDGLEKVFTAVQGFATGRVVALFGCAGDRDRTKRPKMVRAVAAHSDFMVITSDNPRREDPMQIINDALEGLEGYDVPYQVIVDRREAILWALDHAQKDDVLVLAGKGHEDYQVLGECTVHFDEHEIVKEYFEKKRAAKQG